MPVEFLGGVLIYSHTYRSWWSGLNLGGWNIPVDSGPNGADVFSNLAVADAFIESHIEPSAFEGVTTQWQAELEVII